MKCVICKVGETAPGTTSVTLQDKDTVVVVKGVPAEICQECSEYYLTQETASRVYEQGAEARRRNAEVEIVRYAA